MGIRKLQKWLLRPTQYFVYAVLLQALFVALGLDVMAIEMKEQPPSTTTSKGPAPSTTVEQLSKQRPPVLTGKGEAAHKNATAFIDWAAASTKAQSELIVKALAGARDNKDIIATFCEEALAKKDIDYTRTLVALSLLGEAKSPYGEECLVNFVKLPLPEKGTVVEGEILEQTALANLQAKAIDGLAYLGSESADRFVLETVAKHPSRIVRAEAIAAYLWNHGSSPKARETLKPFVKKDELIFLDRVVRQEGEGRESFNRKLQMYLKAHPEVHPLTPVKAPAKPEPTMGEPPKF